ncbi:STP1 protein [Plasmodium brasilianum]|uniref:STP1 protein n=1 Tax=Plasmodium brasilianum TaxID=5824 RepID=A0ACB9YDT1_PLABR|nr:STP1 protein [Plasmodium brasilianum]
MSIEASLNKNYKNKDPKILFPTNTNCNIRIPQTFIREPICIKSNPIKHRESEPDADEKISESTKSSHTDVFLSKSVNHDQFYETKKLEISSNNTSSRKNPEEFQNVLYEYEIEESKNNISLTNIEKLDNKEHYKELYIYVKKKKTLAILCLLVFITALKKFKKKGYIRNRELCLNSSINKRKTEENSYKKTQKIENCIETNNEVLENNNKEINDYILEDNFKSEIKD